MKPPPPRFVAQLPRPTPSGSSDRPPELDVFETMLDATLVWQYDGDELASADDLRLVAANAASEQIGARRPMRQLLGLRRGDMTAIEQLDAVYVRVANSGQAEELRDLHGLDGALYDARIFPLPGRRVGVTFLDVTRLRRSEEGYRRIFDRSHDAILLLDPESEEILDANPAAEALYGRPRAQLIGTSTRDFSRERSDLVARVLDEGFVRFDSTHRRDDGAEVHLEIHATPADYNGRTAILSIARDVTEETRTRRALAESEQTYRSLVANVPVVLWTADAHSFGTFRSPSVEKVTGFTAEEMRASDGKLWWERIHPDDYLRVLQADRDLFQRGAPLDVEYRFLRRDGTWAWFADQASHTYEKDGRILADGVTQDITERKRGELQQLALAEFGRRALTENDDVLMAEACEMVARVLEVPMTSLPMYSRSENAFRIAAAYGVTVTEEFRIPNDPERLATQAFLADAPIAYTNLTERALFDTSDLLRLGTKAGVIAAIASHSDRYGVLHAHTGEPRRFSDREVAFVQSMANVLAAAIQRCRADRELERREAQLADAQALAHIGSLELDLTSEEIEWSAELYRIAGVMPTTPITLQHVQSMLPGDSLSDTVEQLRGGDAIEREFTFTRPDGTTRVVHLRARMLTDRATGRAKAVGTVQDITAQREAESALRDRERRLELIVARLPVILWSTDDELRLTSLTGSGFETINDWSPELTLMLSDLLGEPPPAPEENPSDALRGRRVTYETRLGNRDMRVHVEPLRDESGAIVGTVGIAFDTTEERRAAEAHAELLEQLHDAAAEWRETFDSITAPLVLVDGQGNVGRMNRAALELSRYDDSRDAIGQPVGSLGEAAIWNDIGALARASLEASGAMAVQGVDHEGRYWDLLASPTARRQTIIIASEVTELARVQEKLRRTERMSEMGALVAGVAHEVRNPLFGISATLDAFEHRFGTEEFRGYIEALREQVDRMSTLMHELLEYGRPIATTLQPSCIASVVHAAVTSTAVRARQSAITVDCRLPESLVPVKMDRPRLLQVFDNLIMNAIQHSPPGSTVEIFDRVADGTVSIVVEDRGTGFRDEDLGRIFEPFFTRRRGGTGLGLSIVRRIVEEHNGGVVAANREGGGATMTVTLPVA